MVNINLQMLTTSDKYSDNRFHLKKEASLTLKRIRYDGPYGTVRILAKDNCMRNHAVLTETMAAPDNPFGAKVYMKVLETFKAEDLGQVE